MTEGRERESEGGGDGRRGEEGGGGGGYVADGLSVFIVEL